VERNSKKRVVAIFMIGLFTLSCSLLNLGGAEVPIEALTQSATPIDETPEFDDALNTEDAETLQVPTSPSIRVAHDFTLTSCTVTEYTDRKCTCGDTDGTVEISDSEVIMQFVGREKFTFSKQDADTYTHSNNYGASSLSVSTLTLDDDGFLYITEVYDVSDNTHVCTYHKIGTYNK
jgi:hypothetical protein